MSTVGCGPNLVPPGEKKTWIKTDKMNRTDLFTVLDRIQYPFLRVDKVRRENIGKDVEDFYKIINQFNLNNTYPPCPTMSEDAPFQMHKNVHHERPRGHKTSPK